jgi:hypothetical protein
MVTTATPGAEQRNLQVRVKVKVRSMALFDVQYGTGSKEVKGASGN